MKTILLILFILFGNSVYSQNRVMFCGSTSAHNTHDITVIRAFERGYSSYSGKIWDSLRTEQVDCLGINQSLIDTAIARNCIMMIRSYSDANTTISLAYSNYPNVLIIMPTGAYPHAQSITDITPELLLTGQGIDTNISAYNIEFHDASIPVDSTDESNVPSFSNGYIAGKLMFIMDSLNCGIWEARYRARVSTNQSYTNDNGYGIINVGLALSYNDSIPEEYFSLLDSIGSISAFDESNNNISLFFNAIGGATQYIIYRNNIIIDTISTTYFLDNVTRLVRPNYYIYKYRAINFAGRVSATSNAVQVKHRKYNKILVK